MMSDDQILEVVQAHKEGKQIQCRFIEETRFVGTDWFDAADQKRIQWNFVAQEYRVKPGPRKPREWTPREWTVAVAPDGEISSYRPKVVKEAFSWEMTRVREVIDD